MFRIIAIISILIIVILFYMKISSTSEPFTYRQKNSTYTNMDQSFSPIAFSNKGEMLRYLREYFENASTMVVFEKNNKKCAFLNTPRQDKDLIRIVVPQDMKKIEGIPYDNVKDEIYENDRHIDENDQNLHTVLNFTYKKNKDNVSKDENKTILSDNKSSKTYNYEAVPYYNSKRVPSQYVKSYSICEKSSYDKNALDSLSNNNVNQYFDAMFPCGALYCANKNTDDQTLRQKVYEYSRNEIIDKNKDKIYELLYSSHFLNWLLKLKKSNDVLQPSNRID
jgi:hypothetical protein